MAPPSTTSVWPGFPQGQLPEQTPVPLADDVPTGGSGIIQPPLAGFVTQFAAVGLFQEQRRRDAAVVERLERPRVDPAGDIETRHILELHRSETAKLEARAVFHGDVDLLGGRDPLVQKMVDLAHHRPRNPVDDEAWYGFFDEDRVFPDAPHKP